MFVKKSQEPLDMFVHFIKKRKKSNSVAEFVYDEII